VVILITLALIPDLKDWNSFTRGQ